MKSSSIFPLQPNSTQSSKVIQPTANEWEDPFSSYQNKTFFKCLLCNKKCYTGRNSELAMEEEKGGGRN